MVRGDPKPADPNPAGNTAPVRCLRWLDPRTRLVWLGVLLVVAATTREVGLLLAMVVLVLVTSWAGGIEWRSFAVASESTLGLGIGVVLLQGVVGAEGAVLLRVGPLYLHTGGLALGVVVVLRLYVVLLAWLQFFLVLEPGELALLLVRLGLPYRYALLAGLALRFLPVLERELAGIFAAQEVRGLELGGPIRKALAFGPVLLPLCLRALRRANEVALALELRAFGLRPRRTFLRTISYQTRDYIVTAVALLCLAGYLIERIA